MKINKNQEIYHIPFARINEDVEAFGVGLLEKGSEFPIDVNHSGLNEFKKTPILVHDKLGCNVVQLDDNNVTTFVKKIFPKFKLGQVVKNIKSGGHFRIWEIDIVQGKVWYRNGWSIATGYENGVHEENLIAADDNGQWDVEHNDKLAEKKNPEYYKFIMSKRVA